MVDVTDRIQLEEELKKSEIKYRSLVENSGAGIAVMDIKGRFTFVNKSLCRMIGYSEEELLGTVFSKYLHPEDKIRLISIFRGAFRYPRRKVEIEFRAIHKNGHIIHMHSCPNLLIYEGKMAGFNAIITDISERRQADEELKKSERMYRALFEFSYEPILLLNLNGMMIAANNKAGDSLGYFVKDLIGKSFRDLIGFTERWDALNKLHALREGQTLPPYERIARKNNGTEFPVEIIATLVRDPRDRPLFIQSIFRDITERKKAEEERARLQAQLVQSEKMAGIGTLTSGIAHEFNNLLQIMSGNVQLAQKTKKPEDMAEALEIVADISDRTTRIIRDLLMFSRQDTEGEEPCDVTEVIESVLSLTEQQLRKNNIELVRDYEETSELRVNKGELQQVFLNMVTNARDAMMASGGTLTIEVREKNGNVEVRFRDTGKGIEERDLSRVFEPFYTTKGAVGGSPITPGTGLGLSVSYGIVKRHGGEIEVESRKEEGTVFTVRLPVYMPLLLT